MDEWIANPDYMYAINLDIRNLDIRNTWVDIRDKPLGPAKFCMGTFL